MHCCRHGLNIASADEEIPPVFRRETKAIWIVARQRDQASKGKLDMSAPDSTNSLSATVAGKTKLCSGRFIDPQPPACKYFDSVAERDEIQLGFDSPDGRKAEASEGNEGRGAILLIQLVRARHSL